jgi:hypothetical protein
MARRFEIQHGSAPKEVVGQDTIDKLRTSQQLHKFSVKELPAEKEAPKPADLTKDKDSAKAAKTE